MINKLVSKKLVTSSSAIGSICWIVSLVSAGTLTPVMGAIFSTSIALTAIAHNIVQYKYDIKKINNDTTAKKEEITEINHDA